MKVFMSFWSKGARADGTDINSWKLSLALAKKHYKEVHLVTDSQGKEILKDLPFTSIINILDNIPNFPNIWVLGKIFAYKYACTQGPFFHLDADFYLWEPLDQKLIDSDIFAQAPDSDLIYNIDGKYIFAPHYDLLKLKKVNNDIIPDIWEDLVFKKEMNFAPINMGIFGGQNTKIINSFCDSVLSLINDPKYKSLWENPSIDMYMIEQFHLKVFCIVNKIEIKYLHGAQEEPENNKKFIHMHGLRTIEPFKSAIAKRVEKEPYDLIPKDRNEEIFKDYPCWGNFPV